MTEIEIKNKLDPLLKDLNAHKNLEAAENLISELMKLIGVETSERKLLNIAKVDYEIHRFQSAPSFLKQAAAYEIPNNKSDLIDLKLYWLKKTTKTNLSWVVGLTPNFEDSAANDFENIGIDFVVPESGDSLIILLSQQYKIRSLEIKDHITSTQAEIFKTWSSLKLDAEENITSIKASSHAKLWDSFNFEPINKKFYLELVESFSLLVHHLEKDFDKKASVMFTTRLIGRLLFVWFLRKKNLINSNINYFQISEFSSQDDFYKNSLEKLFFSILNQEIPLRQNEDAITPYLNGGLFDTNQTDFVNDSKLTFPTGFFNHLFAILNKYNFTVDESSPEFQHVAIDPEMLGRIFESLLAEQIDESTGNNKKKSTGAFYTPREIVSYMCEESLIHFLKSKIPYTADRDKKIEELIRLPEAIFRDQDSNKRRDWKTHSEAILKVLDGDASTPPITILDPAVGSGAFSMGMLHLLIKIYSRLDVKYEKNISLLKRKILSKSLYGVDIEQTAIEICRLRAWLSIIVDIPADEAIYPLPNLDFKFTCANTLIPLDDDKQRNIFTDDSLKEKLMSIRDKYFNTNKKSEKIKLQTEYVKLTHTEDMFDNKKTRQLKSYKPFDVSASSEFYDPKLHHGVDHFDIVIGNPPYVQIQKFSGQQFQKSLEAVGYKTFSKTGDLYCLFYEIGLKYTKSDAFLCFITSNKWMRAGYGEKLRDFFSKLSPLILADLGPNIFESATVDTNILLIKNSPPEKKFKAISVTENWKEYGDLSKFISNNLISIDKVSKNIWIINDQVNLNLKEKIESLGSPLSKWDININYGIKTGLNDAFIINGDIKDILFQKDIDATNIIKPVLRGKYIGQYSTDGKNEWLLFVPWHFPIQNELNSTNILIRAEEAFKEKHPEIFNYLLQFKSTLLKRNKEEVGKRYEWYALQRCAASYFQEFEKEKIIYQEIVRSPQFFLDEEGKFFCEASTFLITGNNLKYLIGLLNSKPIAYFFKQFYAGGGLGSSGFRYKKKFLENLPLPKFKENQDFASKIENKVRVILDIRKTNNEANITSLSSEIDNLIYEFYNLNSDEILLIEKTIKQ